MTEAKVDPMALQSNQLQRDDLGPYWQPLKERRRDHGKTGNVPTTNRIKEERAHKRWQYVKKDTQGWQRHFA